MSWISAMVMLFALAEPKLAVTAVRAGLDSEVEPRFGQAQWFMIHDPSEDSWRSLERSGKGRREGGAGLEVVDILADEGVKVVITGQCGPPALQALSSEGIRVYQGSGRTVEQARKDYAAGLLRELK